MRGTVSQAQLRTSAMIDMLESRTLLSADWAGTWQVQGVDLTMRSLPTNGKLAVTMPALTVALTPGAGNDYTAVLTTKVGTQVRTETRTLQMEGQGLTGDFTSEDTAANGAVIHWRTYIRMMEIDDDVRMFDMTSAGYTDTNGTQRIYELNMFAGVASQQKLQVVSFPYTGNYSFHGFRMMADTQDGQVQVDADYSPRTAAITRTGSKAYNIATQDVEGTTSYNPFLDQAGRLSQITAGSIADGASYIRYLQMYYRGPHGRLYFRSGGMEANTNPGRTDAAGSIPVGQILSGSTWVGYSDTAPYNFAPILTPSTGIALNAIDEDQIDNQGTTIADLVGRSDITDWNDPGHKGVAIIAANSRHGTWEYSTNGGTSWQPVGKVSTGHALLLSDSDLNRVRFVPKANYNGTLPKAIRFRAWDQSVGANGTFAFAAPVGKLTAFSATRNYASLQVNAVNDAPVLSGILPELTLGGTPVRIGGGLKITDVDSKLLSGATVTITGVPAAGDVLTYAGAVPGITAGPATTSSTVQLTGTAALAAYLAAIRSITFTTSGTDSGDRTISMQVSDGNPSNIVTQTVHVPVAVSPLATSLFSDTSLATGAAGLLT